MTDGLQSVAMGHIWLVSMPPEQDEAAGHDQAGAATAGTSLKVLIVEDEFFIALDIQEQVEALGHTVVGIAVSVDQAVELAVRESPDVILMDIRLSGPRDGIDAAVEIGKRLRPDIIFVTANTDPGTLRRAQAINSLGVLQKPLTQSRLRDMLTRRRATS
jgi:two-component system, response regulator PdtaR